jgi:hypothetical protein
MGPLGHCNCLICGFRYGELRSHAGDWRVRDFGSRVYADLSMPQLQELLMRNIHPYAAEKIRREIESRGAAG